MRVLTRGNMVQLLAKPCVDYAPSPYLGDLIAYPTKFHLFVMGVHENPIAAVRTLLLVIVKHLPPS